MPNSDLRKYADLVSQAAVPQPAAEPRRVALFEKDGKGDERVRQNNYVFNPSEAPSFPASPVYANDMTQGHIKEGDAVALTNDPDTHIGRVTSDGIRDELDSGGAGNDMHAENGERWAIKVEVTDPEAARSLVARGVRLQNSAPGVWFFETRPEHLVPFADPEDMTAPDDTEDDSDVSAEPEAAGEQPADDNNNNSMQDDEPELAHAIPKGDRIMETGITPEGFKQHMAKRLEAERLAETTTTYLTEDGDSVQFTTVVRVDKILRHLSVGRIKRAEISMFAAKENVIRGIHQWLEEIYAGLCSGKKVYGLESCELEGGRNASYKHGSEAAGAFTATCSYRLRNLQVANVRGRLEKVLDEIAKRVDGQLDACLNGAKKVEGVAEIRARYPATSYKGSGAAEGMQYEADLSLIEDETSTYNEADAKQPLPNDIMGLLDIVR